MLNFAKNVKRCSVEIVFLILFTTFAVFDKTIRIYIMMKKVILSILVLAFPIVLCAQSSGLFSKKKIRMNQPETAYMQGAVPVVDGHIWLMWNMGYGLMPTTTEI